ncbi:MAG TPA: hypothetical protein DCQ98_20490 [Planctomycetaceae bacterium]|nr:hypothetical protein [Planctomycetaceae bacterium]
MSLLSLASLGSARSDRDVSRGNAARFGLRTVGLVLFALAAGSAVGRSAAQEGWGPIVDGLRCRVVPVEASMSEEAIEPSAVVRKFRRFDQVAFVVEVENASDSPVMLLDTRYGDSFGEASGDPNSDWSGQYLFEIRYRDAAGKTIAIPETTVIDANMVLGSTAIATVEPRATHRFLLRPEKWLSSLSRDPGAGTFTAEVIYRGMPERVKTRLREYRDDSAGLNAWSGELIGTSEPFEIEMADERRIAWGPADDGIEAGLEIVPSRDIPFGSKSKLRLHLKNVSDGPLNLSGHLWQSELPIEAIDAEGKSVDVSTAWYSGWTLSAGYMLQPGEVATFDAGNLGLAADATQAEAFEHVTNRKMIVPPGKYRIRSMTSFGASPILQDGEGNVLIPREGDWQGKIETGWLEFETGHPQ